MEVAKEALKFLLPTVYTVYIHVHACTCVVTAAQGCRSSTSCTEASRKEGSNGSCMAHEELDQIFNTAFYLLVAEHPFSDFLACCSFRGLMLQ